MHVEPRDALPKIMLARYYGASLSRFLSTDPGDDSFLEDAQSWNKYAYVRNNPLAYSDPTGMYSWGEFAQDAGDFTIGALRGAAASVSLGSVQGSTPQSGDSSASLLGQLAGSTAVTIGGIVTAGAGATEAVATSPAAVTVVGAVVPAAGVAVAAAGVTVAAGGISNMSKISDAASGQTASGHPTDAHGNKLGGSGKPQVHKVEHSTKKGATDAARAEGAGKPVTHASPKKGNPHKHATDQAGEKKPGSTHHEYPPN